MNPQWKKSIRRAARGAGTLAFVAGAVAGVHAAPSDDEAAKQLIVTRCGACHLEIGKLNRISEMRKTPEGWDMTVVRMGMWHKLEMTPDERRQIVKYLADTQGLAPSETAPFRALIERQPNLQDKPPTEELGQMCGRCHSFGLPALQRRDEDEWRKLMHTHLGQFPSAEYSALGRDRDWWEIARDRIPVEMAKRYPKDTPAWREWKDAKHRPVTGQWVVAGKRADWGPYTGTMTVRPKDGEQDRFEVKYQLRFAAGDILDGQGEAVVYTGYEWRGSAQLGNVDTRSIFALSPDGSRLTGRWFLRDANEIGASFEAVRRDETTKNVVVSVLPHMLRTGETVDVTLTGAKLDATVDLGPGVEIVEWLDKSPDALRLRVKVAADAPPGVRKVAVGGEESTQTVAVYQRIDSVRVEPFYAVARVSGGTVGALTAQFDAVAFLNGPDGKPGTDDDVRLGSVPATWATEPYDDQARQDEDVKFAGHMSPHGQFIPNFGGPNPDRHGHSNVGNLSVVATVADGGQSLQGKSHLVVAAPVWNITPLR